MPVAVRDPQRTGTFGATADAPARVRLWAVLAAGGVRAEFLTTAEFAPRWTCWWRRAERRREAHRQVPRGWNYHVKYQALTRPQAALEGGHTTCSRALQRGLGLGRLLAGGDALSGRAGVAVGAERWHRHRAREHDRGGRRRPFHLLPARASCSRSAGGAVGGRDRDRAVDQETSLCAL